MASEMSLAMFRRNIVEIIDQVTKIIEQFDRRANRKTEQFFLHDMLDIDCIDATSKF